MRHHDPTECQMVALGGLADVRVTVQGVAPDLPYILARGGMVTGQGWRTHRPSLPGAEADTDALS